jgi:hypothetical protein
MFSATLIVLVLLWQTPDPSRDPVALVGKLSYAEREATKSLENLGSKALPALRSALKAMDPEVRTRAKALMQKIEGNILIQPSMVRLDFKDATLEEIVKSLAKQAGVEIGLGGIELRRMATNNIAASRVNLQEPQPIPFWNAIDRLCEVGQLTRRYQPINSRAPAMPPHGLLLSNEPVRLTRPGYNHGPFHFNVISLSYQSHVSFDASDRMRAQLPAGRIAGFAKAKGARPPAEPLPVGASGPGEAQEKENTPVKRAQFQVQLQIIPEPRMTLDPAFQIELIEAADELGQSLLPTSADDKRALGFAALTKFDMETAGTRTTQLHRLEAPGKLIKILRGTAEVLVSAPGANPLVIAVQGAVGKTFENDDRRVVVKSIDTNAMTGQTVIELTIDNIDELFLVGPVNGPEPGAPVGRMARAFAGSPGFAIYQSPIEVRTSEGQIAIFQTSIAWDSGHVRLIVNQTPTFRAAKEIWISSIVHATAKVPFEFHDLPMP